MSAATPNILLVHWHDTGRYLGAYGLQHVRTPHVDRLAEDGVVFERAFSTAPLCSPSRGSLFTGRYPHSNGLMGLAHLGWEYHANEYTLPMLLSRHGYHSVLVGLQHESSDPTTLGFDDVIDLNADRQAAPAVAELAVDRLATLAAHDDPFLMVVGMFEPHRPFPEHRFPVSPDLAVDVPPYLAQTPEALDDLRGFASAVTYADAATGRILDQLAALGLDRNTIVVFTTDHGAPFPRAKSTLYDAGIETALIVRMPAGTPRPSPRSRMLTSHVDLVPTLLELVGAPVPGNVQGTSFAAALVDGGGGLVDGGAELVDDGEGGGRPRRDAVYAEKNWHDLRQYDPVRCVRTERYKYIVSYEDRPAVPLPGDIATSGSAVGIDRAARRPPVELYDLDADPFERDNLAGSEAFAEVEKDLAERLATWQRETGDPVLQGPVPAARVTPAVRPRRLKRTAVVDPQFVQHD
jgi:arylsulfatase A-like enzyme